MLPARPGRCYDLGMSDEVKVERLPGNPWLDPDAKPRDEPRRAKLMLSGLIVGGRLVIQRVRCFGVLNGGLAPR